MAQRDGIYVVFTTTSPSLDGTALCEKGQNETVAITTRPILDKMVDTAVHTTLTPHCMFVAKQTDDVVRVLHTQIYRIDFVSPRIFQYRLWSTLDNRTARQSKALYYNLVQA